ncbi:BT0820 family HAD-type phosphatase [Mangrovibacterium lignilyticum]|uniref:BT0820 family HAD-type phosphatase n=1 Tax=Mangrovibacterium lignilyticum TaxID=2668052 RepID=UPI0013D707C6|nr:hydrolase [Mangrovibacterium lignilyticum]
MIIAVDFDGTIVTHEYPKIGKDIPFAIDSLLMLQEEGIRIILWTVRHGKLLDEAVDYCRKRGLEFYAVNKNYPEEDVNEDAGRKIVADCYIDDRNLGGLPSWGEIYQSLSTENKPKPKSLKSMFSWRRD